MNQILLTVNVGSSSLRLDLFNIEDGNLPVNVNTDHVTSPAQYQQCLQKIIRQSEQNIDVITHRIVHGGNKITRSQIITPQLEAELESLAPLAPLHNPLALKLIRLCRNLSKPEAVQIAVPDTAFYAQLPEVAQHYALPRELCEQYEIRRYGFHGIAHQAMLQRWVSMQAKINGGKRVISIQLGAGCSITASRDQKPIDTSMGFTPLEGLVMATRCGDVDVGILLYLQQQAGISNSELEQILNKQSGLLGLSGKSADMRELLRSEESSATLAVNLYCYRVKKYIGAYMAVLGGADAILFGGGAGENSPVLRDKIINGLEWMGVTLNSSLNQIMSTKARRISTSDSKTAVWVIPVDESREMALEAVNVLTRFNHAYYGG